MAKPKASDPTPEAVSDVSVAEALAPEPPQVEEPLTPEEVQQWNRYYDRYVAGGVLLLVFLVSCHKIASVASPIWPMLRTGEIMVKNGSFVTTDLYSYSEPGHRWVNVPWIYEAASHLIYANVSAAFATEDSPGDQVAAGVLVALNALARLLAVVLVLRLRRDGPGLWWFAVVATIAFGCVPSPRYDALESGIGGIARLAILSPETWGVVLLAAEVLLLDRALVLGKRWALYALPPLFLLWANLDDSVAFGMIVLVVGAIASMIQTRRDKASPRPSPAMVGGIVLGSIAVCLLNPSTYHLFPTVFEPFVTIPRMLFTRGTGLPMYDHLAYFGSDSWRAMQNEEGPTAPAWKLAYYLVVVFVGLATFALNRRRFDVYRLVLFVLSAVLWGGLARLSAEFAVVFAYVVGLNGQEWYHRVYGDEGRLGGGWTAWSIGGRCLTIGTMFLVIAATLTGFGAEVGRPTFGFGYVPSGFAFEAADYLKTSKIAGKVLNLSPSAGDAIIWRAYPERRTFIDRRRGVFDPQVRADLAKFRSAFTAEAGALTEDAVAALPASVDPSDLVTLSDDPATWRPVMDKYGATAVLLPWESDFRIYGAMLSSKNWIPLYDDGRIVIFGRADAPAEDLALFQASKLDANDIVYRRKESVPFPDRPPAPMTFIDRIIRNRSLGKLQPHTVAGEHWLSAGATLARGGLPDAAHAIMAIREARKAIHYNPDESDAYRLLDFAYEKLSRNEFEVFAASGRNVPRGFFNFRARQRITALTYAIQTTPPPSDSSSRAAMSESQMRLALIYRQTGDLDLERDALAAARELYPSGTFPIEESKRLADLDDAIQKFKDQLDAASGEPGMDDQVNRSDIARGQGFTGLAIQELEDAEDRGVPVERYLNMLVSLYVRSGQPEKANERLASRPVDEPALYNGPGTPSYTNGLVNLLLGFYDNTVSYWRDAALPQALQSEREQSFSIARTLLAGRPDEAVNTAMDLTGLPSKPGLIEIEASWEFELALCLLESGDSKGAGQHFVKALEFNPQISVRALIEDYLKKLDVPIPPDPNAPPAAEAAAIEAKPEAPPAAEPKPEPEAEAGAKRPTP